MAGDWIKIEHATPDKPEVVTMAGLLGIDQDAVVGKLVRLWVWVDQQSQNGHTISVTDVFINRITFCDGFATSLRKVGWLTGDENNLEIPNFERHNGKSAKKRAEDAERQRLSRKNRDRCHTENRDKCHTETVTREEKRREENKEKESSIEDSKKKKSAPQKFTPPSHDEVKAYAEAIECKTWEAFVDHFTSNGWKVSGRAMMKDWKAALRNWGRNEPAFAAPVQRNGFAAQPTLLPDDQLNRLKVSEIPVNQLSQAIKAANNRATSAVDHMDDGPESQAWVKRALAILGRQKALNGSVSTPCES